MNAHQIIIEAKRLIDSHGWTQNKYGNEASGFCAVGALEAAANGISARKNNDGVAPIY